MKGDRRTLLLLRQLIKVEKEHVRTLLKRKFVYNVLNMFWKVKKMFRYRRDQADIGLRWEESKRWWQTKELEKQLYCTSFGKAKILKEDTNRGSVLVSLCNIHIQGACDKKQIHEAIVWETCLPELGLSSEPWFRKPTTPYRQRFVFVPYCLLLVWKKEHEHFHFKQNHL